MNANDDVKRILINLLSSKIQGYKRNGGSTAADKQSIKNQINSLNIDANHKQQMIQILVSNFKGPQSKTDINSKPQTGTTIKSDNNVNHDVHQNIGKATVTTSENLNQGTEPSKNTPQTEPTLVVSQQSNINQNIGAESVTTSQISNEDSGSNKILTQPVSPPAVSQQSQDQFEYLNKHGENVKNAIKILTEKNVQESSRQTLLDILITDSEANGTYAEFVLKLINEILSWNMGTYEQQFVLELLVTRIQHSHATIECSPCEIYSFKTRIDQLNLPSSIKIRILYMLILNFYDIKNQILEIMVVNNVSQEDQNKLLDLLSVNSAENFKGQLLHPSNKSEIGYSQSNAAQVNKINASGENQGSCIGSCSGGAQYLPHADCSKFCQCSNGRPILMPCSPTLHWDTKLNTCDAPDVAQCQR
uniref:Chitin-binding type-2 domain-containing protein n=1 Tax=Trichogramma kaykai TaxID=54128 RepID=A0ABD2XBZ1_9HYME